MSRTSALGNFTLLPVLADAADITAVGTTMADRIEKYVLMRFTSVANRDATVTSPEQGMHCVTTDLGRMWVYSGAAWVFLGYYLATGRPGVILTDSAQAIGTSSVTDITWGTEVSDVDGWTAGGIATLTVPAGWGGRYNFSYNGRWASSPTTETLACVYNGSATYETSVGSLGVGTNWVPSLDFTRLVVAGDTIKFTATQSSGGNVNLDSRLEIAWVGL